MFYLLEDNRIIDDKKMEVFVKERQNLLFLHRRERFEDVIGQIKMQSENVFDLIEKDDLIKISFGGNFSILEVKNVKGEVSRMSGIVAIYKPILTGDYIKVWGK